MTKDMGDTFYRELCCAICKQAVLDWKVLKDVNSKRGKELLAFFDSPFFYEWSGLHADTIVREVPRKQPKHSKKPKLKNIA